MAGLSLVINDRIRKRTIDFFSSFKVNLKFDSVASTWSAKFFFDPTNRDHAELACVSHFHEAILKYNDEVIITGYAITNVFNHSAKAELVEIGGYTKCGTIEDCDVPVDEPFNIPLETESFSLLQIAQKLLAPFKLKVVVEADTTSKANLVFEQAGGFQTDDSGNIENESPSQFSSPYQPLNEKMETKIDKTSAKGGSMNIKEYLTELAKQRNIILSHDANGNLLFTEAKTNAAPIMYFNVPQDGLIAQHMSMSFNGQSIHSHITIVGAADIDGGDSDKFTIRNPFCPILYRPKVIVQTSGTNVTIQEAARQALSVELKTITLTIKTDRFTVDGKLLKPGMIIKVLNPNCFIYNPTNWFIESVEYEGDAKHAVALLTCVLPEVYNKSTVKNIFVDVHKNLPRVLPKTT